MARILASAVRAIKESDRIGYIFLIPYIVFFIVVFAYPVCYTAYLSFMKYNPLRGSMKVIGINNYLRLFTDTTFHTTLLNIALYLGIYIPATMAASMALALLLNLPLKGKGFFRVVYFMPIVIGQVIVSLVWMWMYSPQLGLFNYVLGLIGLPPRKWLMSSSEAMPALALMSIWRSVGFFSLIYLAGLQTIPENLYKAAHVDGSTRWGTFWHVTFPLLNPTTIVVVLLCTIWGFNMFIEPYMMTGGGPGISTLTPVFYLYERAFLYLEMGYGSTIGIVLTIILLMVSILERKYLEKTVVY